MVRGVVVVVSGSVGLGRGRKEVVVKVERRVRSKEKWPGVMWKEIGWFKWVLKKEWGR